MKKISKYRQPNSFTLMSEAFTLVKAGGSEAALLYYLGTLPFAATLLFFWNDMSHSGFAQQRLVGESLAVAAAFLWMKVWQSFFCQRLLEVRTGLPAQEITLRRLGRCFSNQASVQPWGLLLIPLSLLLMAPFAATHAFFQNHSVLDDDRAPREIVSQAVAQARLWPLQNHLIIWLLSPWLLSALLVLCFGSAALLVSWTDLDNFSQLNIITSDISWMVIGVLIIALGIWPAAPLALTLAVNFGILLWVAPQLLNSLFGWETTFVRGGIFSIANSTALLTINTLTYLVLDPVMKSAYVLRCFHGVAARTGTDLLADLKKIAPAGLLISATLLGHIPPAAAEELIAPVPPPETVRQLDHAIDLTLRQEEYAYRVPRQLTVTTGDSELMNAISDFFHPLLENIGNGFKWLAKQFADLITLFRNLFKARNSHNADSPALDFSSLVTPLVTLLAIVSALFGLYRLYRSWHAGTPRPPEEPLAITPEPDLTKEELSADLLPETEWLRLGEKMMTEGNSRLALRAYFLAGLAMLAHYRLIRLEPFKSNRDYAREIGRYRHHYPELPAVFADSRHLFEKTWYGNHPVADPELIRLTTNQQRLRGYFANSQA